MAENKISVADLAVLRGGIDDGEDIADLLREIGLDVADEPVVVRDSEVGTFNEIVAETLRSDRWRITDQLVNTNALLRHLQSKRG